MDSKRRIRFWIAVLVLGLLPIMAWSDGLGDAGNSETLSSMTSPKGLTTAYLTHNGAPIKNALLVVRVASVKVTVDGSTPQTTAAGGHGLLLANGQNWIVIGTGNCQRIQAINETAGNGAVIDVVEYY